MLNAGAEDTQHSRLRGLSVMTVRGTPKLSEDELVEFVPLRGFETYTGHPFDTVWESASSVWFADAGPGATGGPARCFMLGDAPCPPPIEGLWPAGPGQRPAGLWDKYSCTLQQWTSDGGVWGNWSWARSVAVSAGAPCYGLAGGPEPGGIFALYATTSSAEAAEPSRVYRVAVPGDGSLPVVSVLATAPRDTQWRAVALPPQPRANYSCPEGSYGMSCDLACAYDCCAPCTVPLCEAGEHVENICSTGSNNVCVPDAPAPSPSVSASETGTPAPTPPRTPSPSLPPGAAAAPAAAVGLSPGGAAAVSVAAVAVAAAGGLFVWARFAGGGPALRALLHSFTGSSGPGSGADAYSQSRLLLAPRTAQGAATAAARASSLASRATGGSSYGTA